MEATKDQLSGSMQENALTLLCFSERYHGLVRNAVEAALFSTFLYRDVVTRVHAYIDQFHKPPRLHLPDLVEDLLEEDDEKAKNLHLLLRAVKELSEHINEEYAVSQLQTFIRQQRLKLGVVEVVDAIEHNDLERAERIMHETVRNKNATFSPGLTLQEAYKVIGQKERNEDRVLTGIPELDMYGYGPTRKQMLAFLAPFKKGKTWWWLHLAKQALLQRWRVLYVTLEVEDQILGQRMLQSLFSLTKRQGEAVRLPVFEEKDGRLVGFGFKEYDKWPSLDGNLKELGRKLSKLHVRNNFLVKQFPTGQLTHNQLVAYLDGLEAAHRFVPDLLIIDYPKLMHLDPRNLRIELGSAYERLRGIAIERNLALGVAAQVNREGAEAQQGSAMHVAEDVSLLGTCDAAIFYNQTEPEHDMGIARLRVEFGRTDRDRYTVLISQAYEIGQFVTSSRMLSMDYWMLLRQRREQYNRQKRGKGDESTQNEGAGAE